LRVCYFGTYDTEQSRNSIIIQGLRANGVEVVECHAPLWRDTEEKLWALRGGWRSPRLLWRTARSYLQLLRRYATVGDYDVMVVGYAGHFDLFLARLLSFLSDKPLVFDVFVSLTETAVEDRGLVRCGSPLAWLLRQVDRWSCRLADWVLLDTEAHCRYFQREFGLSPARLRRVPVGADEVYHPRPSLQHENNPFRVLYFGQYIPLHGVEYVVRAAGLLGDRYDIRFDFVGQGQTYEEARTLARELGLRNATFHPTWLPAEELIRRHILLADLCLGVFGLGPKAQRVVPYKVFVALALTKPLITGDSPAAREVLIHGETALLCPMGDPQALARAILQLKENPALRQRIAEGGYRIFQERFSPQAIGVVVKRVIKEVVERWSGAPAPSSTVHGTSSATP
jgi:glycosyltransferase involved in cell wall biosynthesis